MKKTLLPALTFSLLLSIPLFAAAQGAAAPAAGATTPASSAKKALVARILKIQQPAIEAMAISLVERPALQMLEGVRPMLATRIAADKRDAVAGEIQADIKKYLDEAAPVVRDRAVRLAPQTVGALLEEKFSEDELKQLVAALESPVFVRYQQLAGDMQKVLLEKLLTDTRSTIEPKVKALDTSIGKRLGLTNPAAPAAPGKPASASK